MDALDVAFAGVVVTGVVGVVSPWVQWLVAKGDRESERLRARDERIHDDEARVCEEALHDVQRFDAFVNKLHQWRLDPMGPDPGLPPLPKPLSEEEFLRKARLSAFASDEVVDAYGAFYNAAREFIAAGDPERFGVPGSEEREAALAASDRHRQLVRAAMKNLAAVVRKELRR